MRDYLRAQGACCKPSSIAGYRLVLRSFANHLNKPIASLNRDDLQNYLAQLCARKLAAYTKVNYLLAVKKYLVWEVERGKLSEALLQGLDRSKLPTIPEYLPRPLSTENDRLLQARLRTSQNPYAPLFLLLRHTGMRISELIHLPKDCVLSNGNEQYLKVPLGKMNTERLVPLTQESLGLIEQIKSSKPLKIRRQDKRRLIGLSGSVPRVYGLLTHRFKDFVNDLQDQGKPVTFHRLRHTYATTLLTGGVGLVSLMKLLGHRRIEMTLRYAKVTPSHLRDEYLKAIRVLEQQSSLAPTSSHIQETLHPSELIAQLAAFLIKASDHTASQHLNLLKRLHRLQLDLAQIHFSQKFKLNSPMNGCVAGLTG